MNGPAADGRLSASTEQARAPFLTRFASQVHAKAGRNTGFTKIRGETTDDE